MSTRDPNITIAAARQEDYDALFRMFEHLHEFNASLNERFELADDWEEVLHARIEWEREQTHNAIWIAWVAGQPAGFLMIEEHEGSPLFAQRHWAEITGIYVDRAYRGTNVSHDLIGHAYDWAADRNLSDIRLFVTANNTRARAFYETEGFTHIQEIWSRAVSSRGQRSN